MLVVVCNLLFVVFNLLSLVLFIPVLQLIFRDPKEIALPAYPKSPDSLVGMGSYIKDFYQFHMATMVKHDPKMALIIVCLSVFAAFFLKNLFRYGAVWFQSELRMVVVRDVRNKIFYKSLILPLSFHSNERRGDIMARMNSDVGEIEIAVVSMLELIFREPIAVIINVVTLILLSPELTLFSLFLLPVSAFVISRINKSLKRTAKQGQEQTGLLYSSIDEALNGIRIIKAFSAVNFIKDRFEHVNLLHQRLITKTFRKKDLAPLINETLGALIMLLLVYFGGSLILNHQSGGLSGEVFLTFIIVFSQMLRPIQGISSALANLAKARVSLDRINEILVQDEVIKNSPDAVTLSSFTDSIGFENVSFSYKADLVLKNVSFTIKKGQTIAIVGESGSGKSTMMDLLPRFYDVQEGAITIDDTDIKDLKIKALRGLIGIVSQESILFNTTVADNISFGDENPNREKIIAAAKIANAYDFILELENGLDTIIGERGNKLSGGQKQRLSIARAILKDSPIILLDEATSSLDSESEAVIQKAIENLTKNKTTIIIAHRLSTIMNCDKILVFDSGQIVDEGSHEFLVKNSSIYKNLYEKQIIN